MKKEDITGAIVYLLIVGLAIVFGITVLQKHAIPSGLGNLYFLFIFGAIVAGVVFNSILFEVAHILGALLGGYTILSVNILGFCFKKVNGKFKFCFASFDGLTGETKILPKEGRTKQANPTAYLLFGSLFFAVEFIAFFVLFNIFNLSEVKEIVNTGYFLLIAGTMGGLILIYNIIPFKLDSLTDGYKLTKVGGEKNRAAFNELLKIEYAAENGLEYVPDETSSVVAVESTNFGADITLNKVYALLEQKNYEEAEKIIDEILNNDTKVSNKVFVRARAQKIYVHIMTKPLDEAKEFYEKEVPPAERREISNDISMPCIRAYILMAGLLDKSRSEVVLAADRVIKAYKKTDKQQRKVEVILYNEAIKKVIEAHPTWELENYLLIETE